MGRTFKYMIFLFIISTLPLTARAERCLIPAGQIIGLHLRDGSVTIADFSGDAGEEACKAGLRIGDVITKINNAPIGCASDVAQALEQADSSVNVTYRRGSRESNVCLPFHNGQKLGLCLRQGIAGVGTVTWYDPQSGTFATLGHGVSNDHGVLLKLDAGDAYSARVTGLQQGRVGQPGALKGTAISDTPFGILTRNTPKGVFGQSRVPMEGSALPVAGWEDIHTGQAQIRSTVDGNGPKNYTVEIMKLYPERSDGRDLMLKVTDPTLLKITGGIVQGMSGSPILQDGRLIGAVTHVLVSEPTMGYGIFIGNMLDAAA